MIRALLAGIGLCLLAAQIAQAGGPKNHTVQIISDYDNLRMYFKPKTIVVNPGDTVTWVNMAAEEHNVMSYPDGYPKGAEPMISPYLQNKGETWSYTFTVKGTYEYHCIPHLPMGMHGSVIVARHSSQDEFHEPTADEMKSYSEKLREFFDEEEFKYKPRNQRSD